MPTVDRSTVVAIQIRQLVPQQLFLASAHGLPILLLVQQHHHYNAVTAQPKLHVVVQDVYGQLKQVINQLLAATSQHVAPTLSQTLAVLKRTDATSKQKLDVAKRQLKKTGTTKL